MPVQGGLVNTHSGQRRLLHQLSPMCTFSVGIVAMALLYQYQGRLNDAEPLFLRALAIGEKTLGPEHPYVGGSRNNLASLYKGQGRLNDAEPLYLRALTISEKALGPDHPSTRTIRKNLSTLQSELAAAGDDPAVPKKAPAE
jgi:tetratricopeptide (TPR) repeat protein